VRVTVRLPRSRARPDRNVAIISYATPQKPRAPSEINVSSRVVAMLQKSGLFACGIGNTSYPKKKPLFSAQ